METLRELKPATDAEANIKETLQVEIGRRNFVRAVVLAQKCRYPQEEIRRLQELALEQITCEYRNAVALRNLAQEWGFSRTELRDLLMKAVAEHESEVGKKRSGLCYDSATAKYLSLRQWVEQFLNMKK